MYLYTLYLAYYPTLLITLYEFVTLYMLFFYDITALQKKDLVTTGTGLVTFGIIGMLTMMSFADYVTIKKEIQEGKDPFVNE